MKNSSRWFITSSVLVAVALGSAATARAQFSNPAVDRHLRNARAWEDASASVRRAGQELQRQIAEQERARREQEAEDRQRREEERRERQQEKDSLRTELPAGQSPAGSPQASANDGGFTQAPPRVVNTGSIADTYRQAANQYRWAASEYRAKGDVSKANDMLAKAAEYDDLAKQLDGGNRPVALDPRPLPRTPVTTAPAPAPAPMPPTSGSRSGGVTAMPAR